jgi:hypothetical protein
MDTATAVTETPRISTVCPYCGYRQDSHAHIGDEPATPEPGNLSLCIECAEPSVYVMVAGRLSLRSTTTAERDEIREDATITAARLAIMHAHEIERGRGF